MHAVAALGKATMDAESKVIVSKGDENRVG
jgi:hypothetical protein